MAMTWRTEVARKSFKNSVKITKEQLSQNGILWFSTLSPKLAAQTVKTVLKMEVNNGLILT